MTLRCTSRKGSGLGDCKKDSVVAESFYMQYMTGFFVAIATQNDAGAESRENACILITEANWSSIEDE